MKTKPVAIVTTIYKKNLTSDEEISLRHLNHFLGKYDKYACVPDDQEFGLPCFISKKFPAKHFTSAKANADLLISREFYESFADYEYILLYELDSLVFSDQLGYWCKKGYDYIGAPWIKSQMVKRYDFPDAVGNGGFALRKVESFIKAIEMGQHPLKAIWREVKSAFKNRRFDGLLQKIRDLWLNTPKRTKLIEDRWFSFKAKNYYTEFKVAPVDEGLRFAFETGPRYCFERNNRQLPFGCHAWCRYDKVFWESYLLKNN